MTNRATTEPKQDGEQKLWKKPELRAIVPARRTRGGGGDFNDQDDSFYDAS